MYRFLGFCLREAIHSLIIKLNFKAHVYVGSSLLDMYAKDGKIHEARGIFECLPERDVVSCTAIISGYAQQMSFVVVVLGIYRKLSSFSDQFLQGVKTID